MIDIIARVCVCLCVGHVRVQVNECHERIRILYAIFIFTTFDGDVWLCVRLKFTQILFHRFGSFHSFRTHNSLACSFSFSIFSFVKFPLSSFRWQNAVHLLLFARSFVCVSMDFILFVFLFILLFGHILFSFSLLFRFCRSHNRLLRVNSIFLWIFRFDAFVHSTPSAHCWLNGVSENRKWRRRRNECGLAMKNGEKPNLAAKWDAKRMGPHDTTHRQRWQSRCDGF